MELCSIVAIITGGVSGLGLATARRLSAAGATVTAIDTDATKGQAFVADAPDRRLFLQADVADEAAIDQAVAALVARFGPPNFVMNAAAVGGPAKLVSRKGAIPMALFDRTMRINLYGAMHVMRAAVPEMMKNSPNDDGERGVIVNVSSGAAWEGQVGQLGYAASKAALVGLTLPLARELAEHGIRVATVAPGAFDTPIYDSAPPALKQGLVAHALFPKRMGRPDEFALLIEEIARNPMHNGRTYRLDAGMILPPSA